MPVVHVNMWEGLSAEAAREIISGITGVFADLGIPRHAVEVVIHEVPKTHWGLGGVPASEARPEARSP
ncbi:MAG: tautomerase family protein [Promethearchaeota archaeon]